jgi:hypothetical protein
VIERLYIERVADGVYDVVCNDLFTTVDEDTPHWGGVGHGVESAIEVLTDSHNEDCEYPDDVAGVRYGFMPFDLIGVAYGGVVRIVPDFQRERVAQRLVEAVQP